MTVDYARDVGVARVQWMFDRSGYMPGRHLGSGAARANTYKSQRPAIAVISRAEQRSIEQLSEKDQELVLRARSAGRPLDPKLFREIDSRGLAGYL